MNKSQLLDIVEELEGLTLSSYLEKVATREDQGVTFISSANDEEFFSYKQLFEDAQFVLYNLQKRGLNKGDELIFQLDDNKSFITLFWACIIGKITPVPLSVGNQDDHKLKVFKVLRTLKKPFVVGEPVNLQRLETFAEENSLKTEFFILGDWMIDVATVLVREQRADLEELSSNEMAYIQYSSGSTGNPKGVVLTHDNLISNSQDIITRSEIHEEDGLLTWMPLTHDMGLIGFHITGLIAQCNQYIIPTSLFIRRPSLWISKASEHQVNYLYSPNFGFHYFSMSFKSQEAAAWDLSSVKLIYNGAEPISPAICEKFTSILEPYGLRSNVIYPAYGLAEASVAVAIPRVGEPLKSYRLSRKQLGIGDSVVELPENATEDSLECVEVGFPIDHCEVRIVNDEGDEVPGEVVGHIQINGDNVTSGYYRNEEATDNLFTYDDWLITGDLGFVKNGRIIVTGRLKELIIINGENYYPHDIEIFLQEKTGSLPGTLVACGYRGTADHTESLLVFMLHKGKLDPFIAKADLAKQHLAEGLGISAAHIIPVRKIPKTTSGKIQRVKLSTQYAEGAFDDILRELQSKAAQVAVANKTPDEIRAHLTEFIAGLFENREIKNANQILDLGFNSLQLSRLQVFLEKKYQVSISIQDLFQNPSLEGLCELVSKSQSVIKPTVKVVDRNLLHELSPVQKKFWLMQQMDWQSNALNLNFTYQINGAIDEERLGNALEHIFQRHESFRTTFIESSGEPFVRILKDTSSLSTHFRVVDLSQGLGDGTTAHDLVAELCLPFDFNEGPPFRAVLIKRSKDQYLFSFTIHHLIFDGWSLGLLAKELRSYYQASPELSTPALPYQSVDFFSWNKELRSSQKYQNDKQYWLNELEDAPVLDLPQLRKRDSLAALQPGATHTHTFSSTVLNELNEVSREQEATLFMTLIAAINVTFSKYSGQDEILIGTNVAGRNSSGLEDQIGCFIRTLCIRTEIDEDDLFDHLLGKVKQKILKAIDHQDYLFEWLVEDLRSAGRLQNAPLFDVLVLLQNFDQVEPLASFDDALAIEEYKAPIDTTYVNLQFEFIEQAGELGLEVRYNTQIFSEDFIQRLVGSIDSIFNRVISDPKVSLDSISLLSTSDKEYLHSCSNGNLVPLEQQSILELFDQQVSSNPTAIAVSDGEKELDYVSLDKISNQLAAAIRAVTESSENEIIGLLTNRSINQVVSMLSILKAGAIFLPIDPEYPEERINYLIKDADPTLVITNLSDDIQLPREVRVLDLEKDHDFIAYQSEQSLTDFPNKENLAYVMYTSGSTGLPKGVLVDHGALLNYTLHFKSYFELEAASVVLHQASVAFDTSIEEIFPVLCSGGRLEILKEGGRDIERLIDALNDRGITILSATPLIINELNISKETLRSGTLRKIISGGDVLRPAHIDKLLPEYAMYNTYGPTEATVCASYFQVTDKETTGLIGSPISNVSTYILNDRLELVPEGIEGELYIGGHGVSAGYLNRPELTAERFVKNPFAGGEQLYRTGDAAQWTASGTIEYLGRIDNQVKIRGYRVEPGEVEEALLSESSIQEAVVVPFEYPTGDKYLCAFIVSSEELSVSVLREKLSLQLPEYMVPATFQFLDRMPLNRQGKLDRHQLNDLHEYKEERAYLAPATPLQEQLVALWEVLLSREPIGIQDNFFELGGHSLKAVKLLSKLSTDLDVTLTLRDIFLYPTIESLSSNIESSDRVVYQSIPRVAEAADYAVSHAQRRLWVIDQLDAKAGSSYNMSSVHHVKGLFNEVAFDHSVNQLIERHEILRTVFVFQEGAPRQKVIPSSDFNFEVIYENLPGATVSSEEVSAVASAEVNHHFDLSSAPLLRIRILRTSAEERILVFTIHHIVSDGWSVDVMIDELSQLYSANLNEAPSPLSPLPIHYRDYSNWQNELLSGASLTLHKDYWLMRFSGALPVLELPTDHPRPKNRSYVGGSHSQLIPAAQLKQFNSLCHEEGCSLYMGLLALVHTQLYRYTGQGDQIVGSPVAGRDHGDLEGQLGFYVNTLALRTEVSGAADFRTLLGTVRQTVLEAYDHQVYPFDQLVEELDLAREMSRNPLFDVLVVLQNTVRSHGRDGWLLGDLSVRQVDILPEQSKFDLQYIFDEEEEGLRLTMNYDVDLFDGDHIERMLRDTLNLFSAVLVNSNTRLDGLDFIAPSERQLLLNDFNSTDRSYDKTQTIVTLFEEQVLQTPDKTALVFHGEKLTYKELNECSNQLAHYLLEQGVQVGDIVGLLYDRSIELIIGVIGILKTGAAYLPLDARQPLERSLYIIDDARAKYLLTDRERTAMYQDHIPCIDIADLAKDYQNLSNPNVSFSSREHAHVIYTSGSTGKPKGVVAKHYSVVNMANERRGFCELSADENILLFSSITFDASVEQLWIALHAGHSLVLLREEDIVQVDAFNQVLLEEGITHLHSTPSFLESTHIAKPNKLRRIVVGGEECHTGLVEKYGSDYLFINEYGPTETTVTSISHKIRPSDFVADFVPIGKPIDNTRVYILDDRLQLVPIQVEGEMYIAGDGLAAGYVNNPQLTMEKYIPNPYEPGQLMYKTGDTARWLPDGSIKFSGRRDEQVKIRGYRIELGEIENAMLSISGIQQVAAIVKDKFERKQLIAYYVADSEIGLDEIREELSRHLPGYMIPAHIIALESLPTNNSGKIDKKSLATLQLTPGSQSAYVAPETETELRLVSLWEETLGVERVGLNDNFFELGGHSLKAVRLLSGLSLDFQTSITLRDIFQNPTVASLVQLIETQQDNEESKEIPQAPPSDHYPLSHAQRRLWFINQLNSETAGKAYNNVSAHVLKGLLDVSALNDALIQLVTNHEILRTVFEVIDGEPFQKILPIESFDFGIATEDNLSGSLKVEAIIEEEKNREFDLSNGPLLNARLIQISSDQHLFLFNIHHIISDGWSMNVILKDLSNVYNAGLNESSEISLDRSIQYKDYAVWQQQQLAESGMEAHETYWDQQLSDPPVSDFPTDFSRPKEKSYEGAQLTTLFPEEQTQRLMAIGQKEESSVFMVLASFVYILLSKYTGKSDQIIGSPTLGRNHTSLQDQIGFYVNTLALRSVISEGDSFKSFIQKVKQTVLEGYEHQAYPFDLLVEKLMGHRELNRNPFFDIMVSYDHGEYAELVDQPEMQFREINSRQLEITSDHSKFDLTFNFTMDDDCLKVTIEYDTDLFHASSIQRILENFKGVANACVSNPEMQISRLDFISPQEKNLLLNDLNAGYNPADTAHVIDQFEKVVAQFPFKIAIAHKDTELSYSELDAASNRLATYLLETFKIDKNEPVGIMFSNGYEVLVSMLAILKAGGCYLPIDPNYPDQRIHFVLNDSSIRLLLTDAEKAMEYSEFVDVVNIEQVQQAIDQKSSDKPDTAFQDENWAYVMYTSGSTGNPKGVIITHENIVQLVKNKSYIQLDEDERSLLIGSLSFDASTFEIWNSLLNGHTLYLENQDLVKDPAVLKQVLETCGITYMFFTTQWFKWLIDNDPNVFSTLSKVLIGGDRLSSHYVATFKAYCPDVALINFYGPTENTVFATYAELEISLEGDVPIGKNTQNTEVFVLGNDRELLPIGVPGELCVSGTGLATGYLNRPELTNEKFVHLPFAKSGRLYCTGDRVKWNADGQLEFLGRVDDQVKIRGYRVEPGEIEEALLSEPSVQQAVVAPFNYPAGDKYLCAFIVSSEEISASVLREKLSLRLPEYMVPASFQFLDQMPLNRHGKLDRHQLASLHEYKEERAYVAPATPLQEQLVAQWESLLSREPIGIQDNFFELGGHSLKAVKLLSKMSADLDVTLTLRDIFLHPTIESLSSKIESSDRVVYQSIPRVAEAADYAVSHAQRRLWVIDQLDAKAGSSYNMSSVHQISGVFNEVAFDHSVNQLIERHEILRTIFVFEEGSPRQKVLPSKDFGFEVIYEDLTGATLSSDEVSEIASAEANHHFDLSSAPLLRIKIIRTSTEERILVFTIHHIVSDGWSVDVMIDELSQLYSANLKEAPSPLSPLPIHYRDYSNWQNELLSGASLTQHKDYWLTKFSGTLPVLELPTDRPRPKNRSYAGGSHSQLIPAAQLKQFSSLCHEEGCSLYMGLLALVHTQLYRYTGQADQIVGSPVAGRDHGDLEGQLGFYVNTLALRTEVSGGADFRTLLGTVRQTVLEAYDHQVYPFDQLVEELDLAREMSRHPLFDVLVVLQNTVRSNGRDGWLLGDLSVKQVDILPEQSKFDLQYIFNEEEEGLRLTLNYDVDLFDEERITHAVSHLTCLMDEVILDQGTSLEQLNYLPNEEREKLLKNAQGPTLNYEEQNFIEVIERIASQFASSPALTFEEQSLSYESLNNRSNQLAAYLLANGIGHGSKVAICLERSVEMMIGLLGILKSGAAYIPIDPDFPESRIEYIFSDVQTDWVVTTQKFKSMFEREDRRLVVLDDPKLRATLSKHSTKNPGVTIQKDYPAYVIYTSGSTGYPKGVLVSHQGILNRLMWGQSYFDLQPSDAVLQKTTFCFDVSLWELFWPLMVGARLVMARPAGQKDSFYLQQLIQKEQVTTMHFVPSMLETFLLTIGKGAKLDSLRHVFCSGEAIKTENIALFQKVFLGVPLYNLYGPTEASVEVSCWETSTEQDVVIGKPVPNTSLYILDDRGAMVGQGIVGELYIGGIQVAEGYLNKPELTSERFVTSPLVKGERLYKTGDVARWTAKGEVEYLGRSDDQFKVRGYRIELGEIEHHLVHHPKINQAAVVAKKDPDGDINLVGYYVASEAVTEEEIQSYLGESLPPYMVPTYYLEMDAMPLNSSGKLDRKSLADLDPKYSSTPYVAARDENEEYLVALWKEMLGLEKVGIHDNFFELGGHSLKAMKMINRMTNDLNVTLSLRDAFMNPTIETISQLISKSETTEVAPVKQSLSGSEFPLSYAQRRLWILDQLDDQAGTAYNMVTAQNLTGQLQVDILARAIRELVVRHEILRTIFIEKEGIALQKIIPEASFDFDKILDVDEQKISAEDVHRLIEEEMNHHFDLSNGPLLRFRLIPQGNNKNFLSFNIHHIISDGWSMNVIIEEISNLYKQYLDAGTEAIPSLPIQYKDYAIWQHDQKGELQVDRKFWLEQFSGDLEVPEVPLDHPRPVNRQFVGAQNSINFSQEQTRTLEQICQQEDAGLFMGVLAVTYALLFRYTGKENQVLGSPVAGRNRVELERQIGFYVNTLALRSNVFGYDSFRSLLRKVRKTVLDAYDHQSYPFDLLVDEIVKERELNRNPLFDIMVIFDHEEEEQQQYIFDGVKMDQVSIPVPYAKFDLTFNFTLKSGCLSVILEYDQDLFLDATISRMLSNLVGISDSFLGAPDQPLETLSYLSAAEKELLLVNFNNSSQGQELISRYGPTDGSTFSEYLELDEDFKEEDVETFVLDQNLQLQPVGVPGELCLSGRCITLGYLNQPELTNEQFVDHPFEEGKKLFRTGDLVKWNEKGELEFLGKLADQVTIRGYRIDPAAVAQAILSFELVTEAVVLPIVNDKGEKFLNACLVAEEFLELSELKGFLFDLLPEYMIPFSYTILDEIPLNENGEPDQQQLESLGITVNEDEAYTGSNDPIERRLIEIWKQVLDLEKIDVRQSFFRLGGHSLKATRMVSLLAREFEVAISLKDVFTHPTIEELSLFLKQSSNKDYQYIPQIPEADSYLVSHSQRRLWVIDQLHKDAGDAYNITNAYDIHGVLDLQSLQSAVVSLMQRHEILRTSFINEDGVPYQQILSKENISFEIDYAEETFSLSKEEVIEKAWLEGSQEQFDLSQGPLFSLKVRKYGEKDYILLFTIHHIVFDGWSMDVLIRELAAFYNSHKSGSDHLLPDLLIQYKDYASWQEGLLSNALFKSDRDYWKEKLSGEIQVTDLPIDHQRPLERQHLGASCSSTFNADHLERMKELCNEEGGSLFMGLLSAVYAFLYRYTGQKDQILGSPVAGRDHKDLESQIGFYVNTLALRSQIDPSDGFRALLQNVKGNVLEAYEHQNYPFDQLVEELNIKREVNRHPLFDVMVVLQNNEFSDPSMAQEIFEGLTVEALEQQITKSKLDLNFIFFEKNGALEINIIYDSELFDQETILSLQDHFHNFLFQLIESPTASISNIDFLTDQEKQEIITSFNDTAVVGTEASVLEVFNKQVASTPDHAALTFADQSSTYIELQRSTDQLANHLIHQYGIKTRDRIGVLLAHSKELVISMLAVMKAGAVYVPIDPQYPAQRVDHIVSDSHAKLLISDIEGLATNCEVFNPRTIEELEYGSATPQVALSPNDLAYIIYTSGSTGNPKGVLVDHLNLVNVIAGLIAASPNEPQWKYLLTASPAFDVSLKQILVPLLVGANLHICENPQDLGNVARTIADEQINALHLSPLAWEHILSISKADELSSLRSLSCGGDVISPALANALNSKFPEASIFNTYGPTEASINATVGKVEDWSTSQYQIGKPLPNYELYVLDEHQNIVPCGGRGELHIGGVGVTRGYLNAPIKTTEKFIANPFSEGMLYKTGDLASWKRDGCVAFHGRIDEQVKIRGYRIEPGEITSAMLQYAGVLEAAVLAVKDGDEDQMIVGYYVGSEFIDPKALRSFLITRLPDYMVPSFLVEVNKIPRTTNGKLDRKELLGYNFRESYDPGQKVASRDELEQQLIDLWQELLGLEEIGVTDNFFEIGGHSLKATKMVSRLAVDFDVQISLKEVFQSPTIEQLAVKIREGKPALHERIPQVAEQDDYPLSNAQKRLWIVCKMDPSVNIAYIMPNSFLLEGAINPTALEQAFEVIFRRHEILRTVFIENDGEPRQKILPFKNLKEVFKNMDLSNEQDPWRYARSLALAELDKPFDLENGPLTRITLLKMGENKSVLLLSLHHIIADGWSMDIMMEELITLYKNFNNKIDDNLSPLPFQYKDFAVWQNQLMQNGKSEEFWLDRLKDGVYTVELPYDKSKLRHNRFTGRVEEYSLSSELTADIKGMALANKTTMANLLLTVFTIMLNKVTGQEQVDLAVSIANRENPDLARMIGFFANLIIFKTDFSADHELDKLIEMTHTQMLEASEHQSYPFDLLVQKLNPERENLFNPLINVVFSFNQFDRKDYSYNSGIERDEDMLSVSPFLDSSNHISSKFDMILFAVEREGKIELTMEYNDSLFKPATIARYLKYIEKIFLSIL